MKEIRLFVFVLLSSLCLAHVDITAGQTSNQKNLDLNCPTSPVNKPDNSNNQQNYNDCGTTPTNLAASSLKSVASLTSLDRTNSHRFSQDDLVALATSAGSTVAGANSVFPSNPLSVNPLHPTTPLDQIDQKRAVLVCLVVNTVQSHRTTAVQPHGTTPVQQRQSNIVRATV